MPSIRTAAAPACLLTLLAAATAAPAQAAPATVVVDNDAFSPKDVAIDAGETVTWDVREGGHNIDVYEGPETFRSTSGKTPSGTQFVHAFDKAGTYRYVCDFHGGMKGTIAVAARPQPAPQPTPKPTPQPSPKPLPSAPVAPVTLTPPAANDRSVDAVSGTPAPVAPAAPAADGAAPTINRLATRGRRMRLRLSEPARLSIRLRGRGSRVVTTTVAGRRGINAIALRKGRYRVSVIARDAAGNTSGALRFVLRVR